MASKVNIPFRPLAAALYPASRSPENSTHMGSNKITLITLHVLDGYDTVPGIVDSDVLLS
jgi:hypothetical protein